MNDLFFPFFPPRERKTRKRKRNAYLNSRRFFLFPFFSFFLDVIVGGTNATRK